MKRSYNRAGKEPTCRMMPRGTGKRIGSEHTLTMYYLYTIDGLTYREIAELYCVTESTVQRRLAPIHRHMDGVGDEHDVHSSMRAYIYNQALQLLDARRKLAYGHICRMTGITYNGVTAIAKRNNLERKTR